MCINNLGHMTSWPPCPFMVKTLQKIFFSRTVRPISMKLGMKYQCLKFYDGYINHDPVMTLTFYDKGNIGHQCI